MLAELSDPELTRLNRKAREILGTNRGVAITYDPRQSTFMVARANKEKLRVEQFYVDGSPLRSYEETLEEDRKKTAQIGDSIARIRETGYESDSSHPHLYNRLLELAEIKPSHTVVELGASTGNLTQRIAETAKEVHAVDLAPKCTETLRRLAEQNGNLRVHEQEYLEFLGQRGPKADAVVSALGTDFHVKPRQLYAQIADKLKANGTLTVLERTPLHEQLRERIEQSGLKVDHVEVHRLPHADDYDAYYTIIRARKIRPEPRATPRPRQTR